MAVAISREDGLRKLGIALYVEIKSANLVVISGQEPQFQRSWKLLADEEVSARYSFREVAANLLSMFQHGCRGYNAAEVRQERGIISLQYLCTEEQVAFSWT
jgi:hypothetical protein